LQACYTQYKKPSHKKLEFFALGWINYEFSKRRICENGNGGKVTLGMEFADDFLHGHPS
jgi:hypothetical protein